MTTPFDIINALKARIAECPSPICLDGKPIHWMVLLKEDGFEVRDSAYFSSGFRFFGENFPIDLVANNKEERSKALKAAFDNFINIHLPETAHWDVVDYGNTF